jgi:hypothetical protein
MIAALGAHFTGNAAIKIVWTSFANANSEDWSVPHAAPDVANWLALGYTSEKMLDAGKQIIDTTMAAFRISVTSRSRGTATSLLTRTKVTWPQRRPRRPRGFARPFDRAKKNCLSTFNPPAPGSGTVFNCFGTAGRTLAARCSMLLWRYHPIATAPARAQDAHILHKSVDDGVAYGMNYIEIYQLDVLNLPAEITYSHNALLDLVPPAATPPPVPVPKPPTGLQRDL